MLRVAWTVTAAVPRRNFTGFPFSVKLLRTPVIVLRTLYKNINQNARSSKINLIDLTILICYNINYHDFKNINIILFHRFLYDGMRKNAAAGF